MNITSCTLCPRECNVDRREHKGYCLADNNIFVARAALHFWEEPCICSKNGSGTVFFSNCTLKCCYCQNYKISHEGIGKIVDEKRLSDIFLQLQDKGADNINLVTPTHYVPGIVSALDMVKSKLNIPVVYNSSGYEKVSTLKMLDGYIDIYLPDLKYMDDKLAFLYSGADNYFEFASAALQEMVRQVGKLEFDGDMLKKGIIIRHLALPSHRDDSIEIMRYIAKNFDKDSVLVSIMSQYTPCYKSNNYKQINRKLSTFEYNKILEEIDKLGLKGYCQDRTSANTEYTPAFDFEGV